MALPIDNPRVNRYLIDKAIDHIDHALGRPLWPLKESYRNYFAVDASSGLAVEFAYSPYWSCEGVKGGMAFFSVTQNGREALCRHLQQTSKVRGWTVRFAGYSRTVPAETASKARYAYYREIADCLPDLTFGDFTRQASVRAS